MSECTCKQACARAHTHAQTHIQHSRNACFGFLLHCIKSCNTFTVKWPENSDKVEVWIKKKCVPYCLCQVEVVTLTQDKERKAKKTQSVQNCRHNPGCAGFPCFKALRANRRWWSQPSQSSVSDRRWSVHRLGWRVRQIATIVISICHIKVLFLIPQIYK